ncbi:hypothetical protein ACRAWD_32130 [Caulobacter segnis]
MPAIASSRPGGRGELLSCSEAFDRTLDPAVPGEALRGAREANITWRLRRYARSAATCPGSPRLDSRRAQPRTPDGPDHCRPPPTDAHTRRRRLPKDRAELGDSRGGAGPSPAREGPQRGARALPYLLSADALRRGTAL